MNHAILDYVYEQRTQLVAQIKKGNGSCLRKQLGLIEKKHDQTWLEVMEILSKSLGEQTISEALFERGLGSFSALMNAVRVQRGLRTYKF